MVFYHHIIRFLMVVFLHMFFGVFLHIFVHFFCLNLIFLLFGRLCSFYFSFFYYTFVFNEVTAFFVFFFAGSSVATAVAVFFFFDYGFHSPLLCFFFRMFLQETYELEDCIRYNTLTSNDNLFNLTGSANITYNANGLTVKGSANATSLYMYTGTLPNNYIAEFDVVELSLGAYDFSSEICIAHTTISNGRVSGASKTRYGTFTDLNYGNTGFTYTDLTQSVPPFHLKVIVENGTATFYVDDVQVHQRTSGSVDIGFKSYNNRSITVKNMKIKAL